MDRKEMIRQAKEIKTEAGVYQIRNTRNNKTFIASTPNLKTINGQLFSLEMGSHRNKALQQDWNTYGKDAFTSEILEIVKQPETGYFDLKDALKKLETRWLEKLQPYGDRGYMGEPKS